MSLVPTVRYGPVTDAGQPGGHRCLACAAPLAGSRATYCSGACRQLAYRRRQSGPPAPPRRLPRHLVVYQCPRCEERYLGQQRCDECNTFCRSLGAGGLCVHCDQAVAVSDLLAP